MSKSLADAVTVRKNPVSSSFPFIQFSQVTVWLSFYSHAASVVIKKQQLQTFKIRFSLRTGNLYFYDGRSKKKNTLEFAGKPVHYLFCPPPCCMEGCVQQQQDILCMRENRSLQENTVRLSCFLQPDRGSPPPKDERTEGRTCSH